MNGIIYLVINKITGRMYVGQTMREWVERKQEHWNKAYGKSKSYTKFYNDLRDYGWDSFYPVFLEENISTKKMLNKLEIYWIAKLNTFKNGLNSDRGGGSTWGYRHKEESKKKMSLAQQGEKGSSAILTEVQVREIKPQLIAGLSIREIARNYDVAPSTIQNIKCCRTWSHVMPELNEQLIRLVELDRQKNRKKVVLQLDKQTLEVIAEYSSAYEAFKETGIQNAHIGSCCLGKRTYAGGYIWRYREE